MHNNAATGPVVCVPTGDGCSHRHCNRNVIDFRNEHVDFQLGSEVYNSSRVAEPAVFVSI